MTDEEKAIDLTSKSFEMEKDNVEWFCKLYKNSSMSEIHTFYNGVLAGLAEGRKESAEENEQLKCDLYNANANLQHITIEYEEENAELKAQIEKVKEWVKYNKYEDECIDCDFIETNKLLDILGEGN